MLDHTQNRVKDLKWAISQGVSECIQTVFDKLLNMLEFIKLVYYRIRFFYKPFYSEAELQAFADIIANRLGINSPKVIDTMINGESCYNVSDSFASILGRVYINQWQLYDMGIDIEVGIAHELRHHFQAVSGRLSASWFGPTWDGLAIPYVWHEVPWEVDAVNFENEIAVELGREIRRVTIGGKVYDLPKEQKLSLGGECLSRR